jgi:uncharacterized protein (DUF488 family)
MIYTTYFANLKKLPSYIIPISICGKAPEWYKGLQYKKLAPKYWFFAKYKEDHDEQFYTEQFNKEVLTLLSPSKVVLELLVMVGNFKGLNYYPEIALVCYEKPGDFCHRHLVADWLNKNGYEVKEY